MGLLSSSLYLLIWLFPVCNESSNPCSHCHFGASPLLPHRACAQTHFVAWPYLLDGCGWNDGGCGRGWHGCWSLGAFHLVCGSVLHVFLSALPVTSPSPLFFDLIAREPQPCQPLLNTPKVKRKQHNTPHISSP